MGILNPRRFALAPALFALSACGGLTRVDSSTRPVDGGSAIGLPGPSVVIPPPTVVPFDAGEAALEGGSDMHLSSTKEAASPACDPGTLGASTYAVGTGPAAIAAGDLDGDKKMDLVVANAGSNDVTVLLSTTGYSLSARYAVGNTPKALAVGDLDGDGRPDVVVANDLDQTVSVLLNQGSNSLAPAVTYAAASYPDSITISDVDGDGKPDIVVANGGSDDISVLLGNGDGTFQLQNEYGRMITQAWSLAMADLNGDGYVDAVVASGADDGLAVLVGAGDGSFGGQQSYRAEQDPVSVALGDVNGDGRLDAVVANEMTYNVSVLLGTGMAGFGAPTSYPITAVATSVALADLNGDGAVYLLVGTDTFETGAPSDRLYMMLGNGDGSFRTPVTFAVGSRPNAVIAADTNGDGTPDIVTANRSDDSITVLALDGCGGTPGEAWPTVCVQGASCSGEINWQCSAGASSPQCTLLCDCTTSGVYCEEGCP